VFGRYHVNVGDEQTAQHHSDAGSFDDTTWQRLDNGTQLLPIS
jgi:hypothetical protein